jgi:hypothetical protein
VADAQPLDTVTRFNDRAADYVRYRPTYPAAAIDAILAGIGPADSLLATLVHDTEVFTSTVRR